MGNDSGALILLIVLIVSAFLLIVIKLTQFVNRFNREKQFFLTEMSRAADYNEYRYWRRELRCLYLCLIPFVTERNVMKVYPVFFHRAKHAAKKKRSDGLMHILAPSMLAICICAICLCGVSWAWFTASTSTGTTAIQAASYSVNVSAENCIRERHIHGYVYHRRKLYYHSHPFRHSQHRVLQNQFCRC